MSTNEQLVLLQKRIIENAGRYFPQFAGHRVRVFCTPLRGSSNRLYRYDVYSDDGKTPPAALVVKFARKPLHIEFDNLTLLYQHRIAAPRGLVAPRPLDYFPDINALLTEKVGGEPLSWLVLRKLHVFAGRAVRQSIAVRIRLCGEWLAHYHRLTRRPDAIPFDAEWTEPLTSVTRELESVGFPRVVMDAARQRLLRLHEFGRDHLAPFAHKHGDFGFHNVHTGDDWVCVFDLNDRRPICVYEDLALFLVTLETKNNWPRYPLFDRRIAAEMKTDFLEGYFTSDQHYSQVLLAGHTLKRLLVHCAKQRRSVASRSRLLLPVFDAFRLKRFYPSRVLRQCELLDQLLPDEVHRASVVRHA